MVTLDNVSLVRRQNSPFHSSHTIKFKQSCNCFLWWCEKKIALKKNIADQGRDNYVALFLLFIFRTCINYTWRWLWIYSGGFFFICKGENKSGGMWYVDLNGMASKKQLSSNGWRKCGIFSRYSDRFWHKLFDYVKRAAKKKSQIPYGQYHKW